jgi:hypothetical protein
MRLNTIPAICRGRSGHVQLGMSPSLPPNWPSINGDIGQYISASLRSASRVIDTLQATLSTPTSALQLNVTPDPSYLPFTPSSTQPSLKYSVSWPSPWSSLGKRPLANSPHRIMTDHVHPPVLESRGSHRRCCFPRTRPIRSPLWPSTCPATMTSNMLRHGPVLMCNRTFRLMKDTLAHAIHLAYTLVGWQRMKAVAGNAGHGPS